MAFIPPRVIAPATCDRRPPHELPRKGAAMLELGEMQRLLVEITELFKTGSKADKRRAILKLKEVASIATTLGFTVGPKF